MLPSVKVIFLLVMVNITMGMISFGLQDFFGGSAFVETELDNELILPTYPTFDFSSVPNAITSAGSLLAFAGDFISFFISIFTFDIVGLPPIVRFICVTPLMLINLYLIAMMLMEILSMILGII